MSEGFQLADDYHKYFAVADAFVLLSVFDCNPLVIFESLAAGLPTICSKHAGNAADFIENGKNGYIVDPDDVPAVADRILAVLNAADRATPWPRPRATSVRKANYDDAAQAFIDAVRADATATGGGAGSSRSQIGPLGRRDAPKPAGSPSRIRAP